MRLADQALLHSSPSGWYHQVENLTDCISINHNWCNAVNLPSLYASMCAKVLEVEHALEDVRELLSHGSAQSPDTDPEAWKQEWVSIVQDVVEKDAGWKYVRLFQVLCWGAMLTLFAVSSWATFWRMILHALRLAMCRPCIIDDTLWPRIPSGLTPSLDFIKTRIRACYEDFVKRPENEHTLLAGVEEVLVDVKGLLNE